MAMSRREAQSVATGIRAFGSDRDIERRCRVGRIHAASILEPSHRPNLSGTTE
jgi:hypothetical protein